jgi:uncharacterized membrane protein YdjX (TVP38/TMEM64 family)
MVNKIINFLKKNKNNLKVFTFIVLILVISFLFKNNIEDFKNIVNNRDKLKELLIGFGPLGALMLVVFQMLQVVIFFIPGEVFQTAAGYIYGTWLGTLLSIVGMDIGGAILFIVTKKYGNNLVHKFLPKAIVKYIDKFVESKKINLIAFLMYLMPGAPKDSAAFLFGLSRMNLKDFLIYSTLGRVPALTITCYWGATIASGNKLIVIGLAVLFIVIAAVSYYFKEHIYDNLQKIG